MISRTMHTFAGAALLGFALVALPCSSRTIQEAPQARVSPMEGTMQGPEVQSFSLAVPGEEGATWLGVETKEVTAEKAKEMKLPAERGVLLGKIMPDSPAAKAGLKENDVVTELNGQRVEGATQFRRMIREIPVGRTAQIAVWRDGRSQNLSVTLGLAERRRVTRFHSVPSNSFIFNAPDLPDVAELPELKDLPDMGMDAGILLGARPRLGIDAEDLSGDFGKFFGAPEGEGVLVREVNPGSAAEKSGLKPGDVITTVNGERIRSTGELREQLAAKDSKAPAKLGVLRNKTELTITVELPPAQPQRHVIKHRTNI
jgi:serine protease Do